MAIILTETGGFFLMESTVDEEAESLPTVSGTWELRVGPDDSSSAGTVFKRPGSLEWFAFNLGNLPQIAAGATILSASVVAGDGLTLEGQGFTGYRLAVQLSGGTSPQDYLVTAAIALTDGTVLNPVGTVRVR
jgi:hypothetical protein